MNLNPQMIGSAVKTGLKMLTSESISTPNAWNTDLSVLTQILVLVMNGQMQIVPTPPPQEEKKSDEPLDGDGPKDNELSN